MMSDQKTTRERVLTAEHLDSIEAFLTDTFALRSFPTFHGIEGWEWRAMLDAARKGLTHDKQD